MAKTNFPEKIGSRVYPKKEKGNWRVAIRTFIDKRPVYSQSFSGLTKDEVDAKLTEYVLSGQWDEKLNPAPEDFGAGPGVLTVGFMLTIWFNEKRKGWKANTTEGNKAILTHWQKADWWSVGLAVINDNHFIAYLKTLEKQGLSSNRRLQICKLLREAFDQCRKLKLPDTDSYPRINPLRDVILPTYKSAENKSFAKNDDKKIMDYAKANPNHIISLPALLLLTTGMRSNELFALQFRDVENNILNIVGTVDFIQGVPIWKKGTKAGSTATRKVGLISEALEMINALRETRRALPTDFILVEPEGGPWGRYRFTWQWRKFLQEAGVEYRSPHVARHEVARNLVNSKEVHLNDAAEAMGWKSTKLMLDTYSSANDDAASRVAGSMAKRYSTVTHS